MSLMAMPSSAKTLIADLGGAAKVAEDFGVAIKSVYQWAWANHIPAKYYPDMAPVLKKKRGRNPDRSLFGLPPEKPKKP